MYLFGINLNKMLGVLLSVTKDFMKYNNSISVDDKSFTCAEGSSDAASWDFQRHAPEALRWSQGFGADRMFYILFSQLSTFKKHFWRLTGAGWRVVPKFHFRQNEKDLLTLEEEKKSVPITTFQR